MRTETEREAENIGIKVVATCGETVVGIEHVVRGTIGVGWSNKKGGNQTEEHKDLLRVKQPSCWGGERAAGE